MILKDSTLLSEKQVKILEEKQPAKFVCDTEYKGQHVAVFYGPEAHPASKSRYMAFYYHYSVEDLYGTDKPKPTLMITDGSFIKKQSIVGNKADNGDIIYSRHRHDYVLSPDESVMIDGGRAYTRTNLQRNFVTLMVQDGELREVS